MISLRERLENSFLTKAHFIILRETLSNNIARRKEIPLKTLLFLPLQLVHNIAKGILCHRIRPQTPKQFPNQDWSASVMDFGQHQAIPHLAMKWLQMLATSSQWRKRWLILSSSFLHITQIFKKSATIIPFLLNFPTVEIFHATANQQNISTWRGTRPNQTEGKGVLESWFPSKAERNAFTENSPEMECFQIWVSFKYQCKNTLERRFSLSPYCASFEGRRLLLNNTLYTVPLSLSSLQSLIATFSLVIILTF